jgi:hypothetical protein
MIALISACCGAPGGIELLLRGLFPQRGDRFGVRKRLHQEPELRGSAKLRFTRVPKYEEGTMATAIMTIGTVWLA